MLEYSNGYCIIGAGVSGLVTAKVFKQAGILFKVFEANSDVGGIWNPADSDSPVAKNTHLISPKGLQAMADFPMPSHYPDFPSALNAHMYLRSYADHFGLRDHISFGTAVQDVRPEANGWKVITAAGHQYRFRGVVVANGHHRKRARLELPGQFSGLQIHSVQYKSPADLVGRRVLVIGAGQSAVDVATDAAVAADKALLSVRRPFVCLRPYVFGRPSEETANQFPLKLLPIQAQLKVAAAMEELRLSFEGIDPRIYGIPPTGWSATVYPIFDERLYPLVRQRRIEVRPEAISLEGNLVRFADGTTEQVDMIVAATGFKPEFPFFDPSVVPLDASGLPQLFLQLFSIQFSELFFVGLINPLGAHWTVYEEQAKAVAHAVKARESEHPSLAEFDHQRCSCSAAINSRINGLNAPERYPLIVDKGRYVKEVRRLIRFLGSGKEVAGD